MVGSDDNMTVLEKKASELEGNGFLTEALAARERLLSLMQQTYGERSEAADEQKYRFGLLTLKWAAAASSSSTNSVPGASVAAGGGLSASRIKKQVPASAAGRRSPALTLPRKAPSPSAAAVRHKNCKMSPLADVSLSSSSHQPQSDTRTITAGLFAGLSVASCLAVAEHLLHEDQTTAAMQDNPNYWELRGRLLLAQVSFFHRAQRPRAALPLLQKAIKFLRRAAPRRKESAPSSVELAEAYLTLCVLLSDANHHPEALAAAHTALSVALQVEEHRWAADPLRSTDSRTTVATGRPPRGGPSNATDSTAVGKALFPPSDDHSTLLLPPTARTTIYCGPLQAACYHNIGVEQEYLGLGELALESFQTGFELAFLTLGERDTLTQRLRTCYAELFASLNFRHFAPPEAIQHGSAKRVLDNPQRALSLLKDSYRRSVKHTQTLRDESMKQDRILSRTGPLLEMSFGGSNARPLSANAAPKTRKIKAGSKGAKTLTPDGDSM